METSPARGCTAPCCSTKFKAAGGSLTSLSRPEIKTPRFSFESYGWDENQFASRSSATEPATVRVCARGHFTTSERRLEDMKCGHGITEWRCAQCLGLDYRMAFQPAHPVNKCIPSRFVKRGWPPSLRSSGFALPIPGVFLGPDYHGMSPVPRCNPSEERSCRQRQPFAKASWARHHIGKRELIETGEKGLTGTPQSAG